MLFPLVPCCTGVLCALPPCSLLYRGDGQVKYCRATLSVLSFRSFLSAASSLHLSSSPDLLIYLLTQSSYLRCGLPLSLRPRCFSTSALFVSLPAPSGLPISSCFFPIFLLGCTAPNPLSLDRSSFCCPPSLFLLFDAPSYSHTLAASVVVVQRHCLQTIQAGVTHALSTFPFSYFEMFLSNTSPSAFLQAFAPA